MSIRWIRNVVVDGSQTTLEVLLGDNRIADKCYVRVNQDEEYWFRPSSDNRRAILQQGIDMLRNRFDGKKVTAQNGSAFPWH
ncbi:MAG: hypothetical protein JWP91_525 [Fibrobacteres bacterium]|nr:hypothetical protein [Fibrobacterota bacterium]